MNWNTIPNIESPDPNKPCVIIIHVIVFYFLNFSIFNEHILLIKLILIEK